MRLKISTVPTPVLFAAVHTHQVEHSFPHQVQGIADQVGQWENHKDCSKCNSDSGGRLVAIIKETVIVTLVFVPLATK